MRRCVPSSLGCAGLLLVIGCGPVHLFGRYDHRPGIVQEREGGDLVERLLDEAVRENKDDRASED